METLMVRNQLLEERLHLLENQTSTDSLSRPSGRRLSPRAFDVEDGSCEGNAAAQPAESCSHPRSLQAARDSFGQQGEPQQSQADGEAQTRLTAADEADGNAAELETDEIQEEETHMGPNVLKGPEGITDGAEVTEVTTEGGQPEPDEPPENTEQAPSPFASQTGSESRKRLNEDFSEPEDTKDKSDVRGASEMPQKAEDHFEWGEREEETPEQVREEARPEHCCSADPDVDFMIKQSERPDRPIDTKRDGRAQKHDSRSLKHPKTSGRGTGTPSHRDQDLSKENLRLASENLELRFQLEQTNKDLPRLKNQVADLKEICTALKKEKAEAEKKLAHIRGVGHSGKTVPELERTIGLMKKVVERVQRENETLKKSTVPTNQDRVSVLEKENQKLKSDFETLKHQSAAELSWKLKSKTEGLEKIVLENERLRKEIKRETEAAERLKVTKASLEMTNEKLEAELEDAKQRLRAAPSGPAPVGADSKTWKASVVTRMFENKMKELENELDQKSRSLSELKLQLKEVTKREERADTRVRQLEDQVDMLKKFPAAVDTDGRLSTESHTPRPSVEPSVEPKQERNEDTCGQTSESGHRNVLNLLRAADRENSKLQAEVRKLQKELENFDPTFFEELEDLKYNYNVEVKKNILLEEQLKKVCERFGVEADLPSVSIS